MSYQSIVPKGKKVDTGSWYDTPLNILDYLNRPLYSIAGAIRGLQDADWGKAGKLAWKGITGEEKTTWSDILGKMGMRRGWTRTLLSIPLDVVTDPLTYIGIGSLTKLGKYGKILGRSGKYQAPNVLDKMIQITGAVSGAPIKKGLVGSLGKKLIKEGFDSVKPLGQSLAEQVALGQRSLLSLHVPFRKGVPITLIKGKKVLTGVAKATGALGKTRFGRYAYGIFNRTTGSKALDDVAHGVGGATDKRLYHMNKYADIGNTLNNKWNSIVSGLGPEDVQAVRDYALGWIEPVGKKALREAKRGGYAGGLVQQKLQSLVLPPSLRGKREVARKFASDLSEAFGYIAKVEGDEGIPLVLREFYAPHLLNPQMRKLLKDDVNFLAQWRSYSVGTKAHHGSLERLFVTEVGNVTEVNDLFKAGYFGETAQKAALSGVKALEDDPIKLFAIRSQMSTSAISAREMQRGLTVLADGVWTPKDLITKNVPKGKTVLGIHPRDGITELAKLPDEILSDIAAEGADSVLKWKFLIVDDELARAAITHSDVLFDPNAMERAAQGALAAYDTAHSFLRRWTLGIFPGWMARNAIGNYTLQWYAGMDPYAMVKYTRKASQLQRAAMSGADELIEAGMHRLPASGLTDLAQKYGVLERGFYGAALDELAGAKIEKMSAPLRLGFKMNRRIENNARLGLWLWQLDQGIDAREAARTVKKYLFDYSALSDIEKKLFKRTCFFYTWLRKNIPMQLETYLTRPGKIVPLSVTQREIMKLQGLEEGELPEWAAKSIPFPLSKVGDMVTGGVGQSWFPFGDLKELIEEPGKKIAGSLSPLGRVPAEYAANFSLWRGEKIKKWPGQTSQMFGVARVPSKEAHLLEAFRPVSTVSRMMNAIAGTKERSTAGPLGEAVRFLTGVRTYRWDLERARGRRTAKRAKEVSYYKAMYRFFQKKGYIAPMKELGAVIEELNEEVPK